VDGRRAVVASDIVGEADLVEEITRVAGFDRIPTISLPRLFHHLEAGARCAAAPRAAGAPGTGRARHERGRDLVVPAAEEGRALRRRGADLRLLNSIDATLDTMRPSVLPNLIDAASRNEARGLSDPALFEVGPQYKDATPTGQARVAAGVRHNMAVPRNWAGPARTVDAFDAKADALAVLQRSARRSRT